MTRAMDDALDCGDNSCFFAERKTGMRTNGGCRCLDGLPSLQRRRVLVYMHGLRDRISELQSKPAATHAAAGRP
jgi:hypothetical protein